jgi:hypothetical protein
MSEPSLPELEAERERLYAQLSEVGDFRRGSVSENYRKCGKLNCACASPRSFPIDCRIAFTNACCAFAGPWFARANSSSVTGSLTESRSATAQQPDSAAHPPGATAYDTRLATRIPRAVDQR